MIRIIIFLIVFLGKLINDNTTTDGIYNVPITAQLIDYPQIKAETVLQIRRI